MKKRKILSYVLSVYMLSAFGQSPSLSTINKWERKFKTFFLKNEADTPKEVFTYSRELDHIFNEMIQMQNEQQYLGAAQLGLQIYSRLNNYSLKSNNKFEIVQESIYSNTEFYAWFLQNLAFCLNAQGFFSEALYYGLEAEKCWEQIKESKKRDKAVNYMHAESANNLATFYYNARDINKAEKWIKKCIELTQDKPGYDFLYYRVLNTEACLLDFEGFHDKALELEEMIINNAPIVEPNWKDNYINFLYKCNKKETAIEKTKGIIENLKSQGLNNTRQYASYLNKLAIYKQSTNIGASISLEEEALNILKKQGNTLYTDYALYLSNLAFFYYIADKIEDALDSEERAYTIWSNLQHENSPSRLSSLGALAFYQFINGEKDKAARNIVSATSAYNENILYSMLQPKAIRHSIWNDCQGWYMNTIPLLAANIQSDSLYEVAYDAVLLSKGILLNTEQSLQTIADEGGAHIRELYDKWQCAKQLLDAPHLAEETEHLKREAEETERIFVSECHGVKELERRLSVSWKDVQKRLGYSDVAIEFCSYKQGNEINYMALIIKKEMNCPKLIPLFFESQLNSIKEDIYKIQNGSKMIWQPIEKYLQNVKNIYFSPCGELHNIAIESLPHWSDKCLISDKWNMYRLSSTRELVFERNSRSIERAVVYGGINYNTSIDMLFNNKKNEQNNTILQSRGLDSLFQNGLKRINLSSLSEKGKTNHYKDLNKPTQYIGFSAQRGGYGYLEGTKKEAEEVCRLLDYTNIQTTLYAELDATEGSMKDLSGKKTNLLHIGTHGFYFPESEVQYWTHLDFLHRFNNEIQYVEDKALTRSGLLFSGANNTWEGKKIPIGIDDGILTAQEISHLDLRELDLVVLAACETGLGEIKGDGVFGLQRGFKKAGANSLLMTLWKVDDEATSLLMLQFYKNLLSGKSKSESLRQAQSITQKKYQDPKFWAGFILLDAIL